MCTEMDYLHKTAHQKLLESLQHLRVFDCIREVYLTTNNVDSMRISNVVVSVVASQNEGLTHQGPFQDLIREVGDFAVDLVLKMAENRSKWG